MKVKLSLLACLSLLGACASTPDTPRYADYQGTDRVCIEAKTFPNVVRLYTSGEAHVWLKQVDGLVSPRDAKVCVPPGKHRIGVLAHNRYLYASAQLVVEAVAGQPLLITANRDGYTFTFRVLDTRTDPASEVATMERNVEQVGQPTPVYLPPPMPKPR